MTQEQFKAPNTIPWPPIIYAIAILCGWLLSTQYPIRIFSPIISDIPVAMGAFLVIGGLTFDVLAIRELGKHKTTVMPHKTADHLVTSGPFAISRNPIYVGNTLLTLGLALFFNNLWLVPAALIAAFTVQKLAIEQEEKHLSIKFGKTWREYTKKTRRWV